MHIFLPWNEYPHEGQLSNLQGKKRELISVKNFKQKLCQKPGSFFNGKFYYPSFPLSIPFVERPFSSWKYSAVWMAQQASALGPANVCRKVGCAAHPHSPEQNWVTCLFCQSVWRMNVASHKPRLATSVQVIGLQSLEAAAGQMETEDLGEHVQSCLVAGTRPKLPLMRDEAEFKWEERPRGDVEALVGGLLPLFVRACRTGDRERVQKHRGR